MTIRRVRIMIDRKTLTEVVNHYLKGNDVETAKSYIKSWGVRIKGFNVEKELKELENAVKNHVEYGKPKEITKKDEKKEG